MLVRSNSATDPLTDDYLPESAVAPIAAPYKLAWLNTVVASPLWSTRVRVRLLRWSGLDVGRCGVWPHIMFVGGHDVRFADGVFVNSGVVFDARSHIDLGPNVAVGPRAQFITSSHPVGAPTHRAGNGRCQFGPITVGEGCWIGAGAIVLGGVRIGSGCIVGAGAVVLESCDANGLYVGVPARRKADLSETSGEGL